MDADALLHPRGPLPPAVYWRRRLVTIGGLLIAVVLTLQTCGPGGTDTLTSGRGTPSPSPRVTGAPSRASTGASSPAAGVPASPSPAGSPQRVDGQPCRDADLAVGATTAAKEYGPGQRPRLTLVVTNRAPVSCTRDLGGAAREIRVMSGADRVWSSDDCSPGGQPDVVLLRPGASRSFPVTWSRTRSRPGCPPDRPAAGPGTYRVIGRIGSLQRPGDTFTLR